MSDGNYKTALEYLDKIQARYPLAAMPSRRNWTPFTFSTSDNELTPRSPPPTASSRPTRAIPMWTMLIT